MRARVWVGYMYLCVRVCMREGIEYLHIILYIINDFGGGAH